MENEELRDILLEKDDDSKSIRLKKLLMFIAALVVLFIVIVVAMKLINSSDSTQTQNEADSRLVLPPVPTEQPIEQPVADTNSNIKKGDTQLFEQVPIVPESKQQDDFEDMIKKLKDKENTKPTPKTEESKEVVKAIEHPAETAAKKPEPKVEAPAKKAEKPTAAEKKPETKPAKPEAKSEKKAEAPTKAETIAKGSYVQVFATSKFNPNADYVKKIIAKGYSYKTIKVGELTKILVGPFDEKSLQKAINDIRKDVNKDAFVFRTK
jgi:hypothetical protein